MGCLFVKETTFEVVAVVSFNSIDCDLLVISVELSEDTSVAERFNPL